MLRVLREAVRGIYLLLIQRGEGRSLESELEGSGVVVAQLRRELDLRGHCVVGTEGVVAAGAGDSYLRVGQVCVQTLVELVLVLTANLHAHDGGVAVLAHLGLVIAAARENVLELLLSARNILGRECVEETRFHGTVQAQGGSDLHALHLDLARRNTVNRDESVATARTGGASATLGVNHVGFIVAVHDGQGQAITVRGAQQGAVQQTRNLLLNGEVVVLRHYLTAGGEIGAACAKQLLETAAQVLNRRSAKGQGTTHFFLRTGGRCGRSVCLRLRGLQTLLQLGALRLDLVQVGVDRRGGLGVHDFLRDEGNHHGVTAVLLLHVKNDVTETAVLNILRRNLRTTGVLHFLLAKLHSGFIAAAEDAVLIGRRHHTIHDQRLGKPTQQVARAEVFLHLNTLHQALVRVDDANLRLDVGARSLQQRGHLGVVFVHGGEGDLEGRTSLLALRLNTFVLHALGQVLTNGRIQRLGAALNLVLVILHVEGNQNRTSTLLGALKTQLGLNLRAAGTQNQRCNGQQNRQEHPALTSRCSRGMSHRVHSRLPSGE